MALQAYPHLPLQLQLPSSSSHAHRLSLRGCPLTATFNPNHLTLTFPHIGISSFPQRRTIPVATVVEESQESAEPEAEAISEPTVPQPELRKEKEDETFWGGVAQEIGEIEWPSFPKVLGTTGVVLGVIFGSSVVLLTVNALLAELSDKLFAGKGVQDFFS